MWSSGAEWTRTLQRTHFLQDTAAAARRHTAAMAPSAEAAAGPAGGPRGGRVQFWAEVKVSLGENQPCISKCELHVGIKSSGACLESYLPRGGSRRRADGVCGGSDVSVQTQPPVGAEDRTLVPFYLTVRKQQGRNTTNEPGDLQDELRNIFSSAVTF